MLDELIIIPHMSIQSNRDSIKLNRIKQIKWFFAIQSVLQIDGERDVDGSIQNILEKGSLYQKEFFYCNKPDIIAIEEPFWCYIEPFS